MGLKEHEFVSGEKKSTHTACSLNSQGPFWIQWGRKTNFAFFSKMQLMFLDPHLKILLGLPRGYFRKFF